MKNYLFLAVVIFAITFIGCEKESLEPELEYQYDTVYVDRTDTLIVEIIDTITVDTGYIDYGNLPNFNFKSDYGVIYWGNEGSLDNGLYSVELNKDLIIVHINDTINFEFNIHIQLIENNFNIVMGTVWNDFENVSGSFSYQSDEWFEMDILFESTEYNFYLYN